MEVQDRILDTAFDLFRQFGTRSITMDDIAQKMGVSKKTLYAHFADKDELVVSAVKRYLECMDKEHLGYQQDAADAIDELFRVMKEMDESLRNMNPVVLFDLQKFHARAYQAFMEFKDTSMQGFIRQNMERGIREGLYRNDLDLDILTRFRMASAMMCFQPELFPSNKYDMGRVQRVLIEHFLYGVVSLEGYRRIEEYKKLHS
jgi:TetR/AcrR family transcriptional regulator, cholesterol catabolism regulator